MKCLLADKAHSLTTLDFTHTRTHPLLLTSILSSLTCGRMATQGHLKQQWLAMSLTQITLLMTHSRTNKHTHTHTPPHTHTVSLAQALPNVACPPPAPTHTH